MPQRLFTRRHELQKFTHPATFILSTTQILYQTYLDGDEKQIVLSKLDFEKLNVVKEM